MDLQAAFNRISEIADRFKLLSLKPQLASVGSQLERSGAIDVAVMGRFKAGKSSFLNTVAGESILPIGVIPVTSVITRLRYGPERKAVVTYQGGMKRQIEISELPGLISESGNPENRKSVRLVEVELPSLKGYEGLEFVDTPGLGSAFKHNTEVSLDWLPRVGAALVAISVDPPLSEQDLDLIDLLIKFTPKVVILLTKADLLTKEHLEEVLQFVQSQLHARFGVSFPTYFFSTQPGKEDLRDRFSAQVLKPLCSAKEAEYRRILIHKLSHLLSECAGYLRIALEASERSKSERERLREQILGEKLLLDSTRDELRMLTREWLSRTRPSYMKRLSALQGAIISQFTEDLRAQFPTWQFNLYRFTRAYEDWLREEFRATISLLSTREEALFLSPLKNSEQALSRAVRSFQGRLSSQVAEFLGVQIMRMEFNPQAAKPQNPDVSVGRSFDSHLDTLWFLIPMTVFRKPIERHFLKQLPWEVEKNFSRLASQWTERVNASILALGHQAERFIEEEVRTMENLLLQSEDSTPAIREFLSEVEAYLEQVTADSSNLDIQPNQPFKPMEIPK